MDIVESSKKVGSEFEEMVEKGIEKGKEVLSNVASHLPFANLAKSGDETYTIEVDLPGIKKEDITINVEGDHLNVNAVRHTRNEVKEDDYYLKESFYGRIGRTFYLPNDLDRESIDAALENGRLTITLKKLISKRSKSIAIK